MNAQRSDEEYQTIISAIGNFRYLGKSEKRRSNYQHYLVVECNECGTVFEQNPTNISPSKSRITCQKCKKEHIRRKQKEKDIQAQFKRMMKARVPARFKNCCECGQTFLVGFGTKTSGGHEKFCSQICMRMHRKKIKRNQNRAHDKRLKRCAVIDHSINLKDLYDRDLGICWLCGSRCDWNDKRIRKRTVICGETYPSIDHVLPIAKGGEHIWENVRLAHRGCNSHKRDMVLSES